MVDFPSKRFQLTMSDIVKGTHDVDVRSNRYVKKQLLSCGGSEVDKPVGDDYAGVKQCEVCDRSFEVHAGSYLKCKLGTAMGKVQKDTEKV